MSAGSGRPGEQDAVSMDAGFFDDFYRRNDDPWGFETRWYEQRKRDLLMAALPRAELGDVLEVGCSTGLVTRRLLERAERVVALDPVHAALDAARRRVGADARATFAQGRIPQDWPDGTFDTIVLSEVGYYLSASDLARAIARIDETLAPAGTLIACHWRHPVVEYPQTGDAVHDALRAHPGWEVTVAHRERDFVLEVFSRPPARSVAQEEGIV